MLGREVDVGPFDRANARPDTLPAGCAVTKRTVGANRPYHRRLTIQHLSVAAVATSIGHGADRHAPVNGTAPLTRAGQIAERVIGWRHETLRVSHLLVDNRQILRRVDRVNRVEEDETID